MILLRGTSVELCLVGIATFRTVIDIPLIAPLRSIGLIRKSRYLLHQSLRILQIPFSLWNFSSHCWLLVLLGEKGVASIHRWPSLANYVTLSLARRNDSDTALSDFRKNRFQVGNFVYRFLPSPEWIAVISVVLITGSLPLYLDLFRFRFVWRRCFGQQGHRDYTSGSWCQLHQRIRSDKLCLHKHGLYLQFLVVPLSAVSFPVCLIILFPLKTSSDAASLWSGWASFLLEKSHPFTRELLS